MEEGNIGWSAFLRIQAKIQFIKPLARGYTIRVKGIEIWVPFKNEKLPRFCLKCGRIMHDPKCIVAVNDATPSQFGLWLRADLQRGGSFPSNGSSKPY